MKNHSALRRVGALALLVLVLAFMALPMAALAEGIPAGQTMSVSGLRYVTDADEHGNVYAVLTGSDNGVTLIDIPKELGDEESPVPVREVMAGAFAGNTQITGVSLPDYLTHIGTSAFEGCTALEEVRFSGGSQLVSIGDRAFAGCASLTEIELPSGIQTIGADAFAGAGLKSVALPDSIIEPEEDEDGNLVITLGEGAFDRAVTVKAHSDSYARDWAEENGLTYEKIPYTFLENVARVNNVVHDFVWGPIMLAVFLFVGLLCTVRNKVFQVSKIKLWLDETILAIFKKKSVRKTDDKKAISQFQALSTALAATVGTGNITGVATAIVSGGPGAIFWMWLSAFLGMMTNFTENVLGIKYRYKNEKGDWVGGAMIYMDRGLNMKWLAVIFSFFCILASFGIGNLSQANSIASAVNGTFPMIPKWVIGIVIMAFAALVIIGGIKRIAQVTEKIVPFMALFYILGGIVLIIVNIGKVPAAFGMIFRGAFNFKAAGGGFLGFTVAQAIRYGIARGVFSNEAGLGSSVMVHSASDVKEPVVQGMWGIFEVFADTICICTITALAILTTVYDPATGVTVFDEAGNVLNGAQLTTAAFDSVFNAGGVNIGGIFISVSLALFAFSTILGWSYYGQRGIEYVFGLKAVPVYKVIFIGVIILGCVGSLDLVWNISDTFNGLMAIPNLFAVILLHGQVVAEVKDYLKRRKEGKLLQ